MGRPKDKIRLQEAVVKILSEGRAVVGTGFLVAPDLVATCAHVVKKAVRKEENEAARPEGKEVELQFWGDAAGEFVTALVEQAYFRDDDAEDVAFLRIVRGRVPNGVEPIALAASCERTDGILQGWGFPKVQPDGLWMEATVIGPLRSEKRGSRLQLSSTNISPGCSGGPLWDGGGCVVGMTVAITEQEPGTGRHGDTAYAITAEVLACICSELSLQPVASTCLTKLVDTGISSPPNHGNPAAPLHRRYYVIASDLRDRLIRIAKAAPWSRDDLSYSYYDSAPIEWRHKFDRVHDADLVLRMIEELAQVVLDRHGDHAILRFVLHLVRRAPTQSLKIELFDWLMDAARSLDIDTLRLGTLQQMIEATPLRSPRDLHLVLVMEEIAAERCRYKVHAFRVLVPSGANVWSDKDARKIETLEKSDYGLDEMPALVNKLVEEIAPERQSENDELTIEFVVPLGLLYHDADCWELSLGMGVATSLGVAYQVVTRSWKRAYGPERRRILARWEAKWQQVDSLDAAWVCTREDADSAFGQKLHGNGPACVALAFAPQRDDTDGVCRVLRTLIASGIPSVAWSRKTPTDPSRLEACVTELVALPPPRIWPKAVRNTRREARRQFDAGHPGNHISLIWDDPNKQVPDMRPEARLASPTKTRNITS